MEIRPPTDDELRRISTTVRAALLGGPVTETHLDRLKELFKDGDWLAMWDGDSCVGHVGYFRFDTTVPGGARVPTAGLSGVGVLPTATRQGVLTTLMTRSLKEARERGQVLSSLRASEAPIYGRFGYGLAGDQVGAVIAREGTRPFRHPAASGSMRLLFGDEPIRVVPEVYDRCARQRVGTINRFDWLWKQILEDVNKEKEADDETGTFVAVHQNVDGLDDGYVHYTVSWSEGFGDDPRGEGKIHALWGADDGVERALWQFLLDIDLIVTWRAERRPTDDPIRRTFHDARAYKTVQRIDEQWVRLLDVDAALVARTYGPAADGVAIEVHDPMFDENCGTWSINRSGATRTSDAPDVSVDITALGAAYLGGISWFDLAASGEVTGASITTLASLDALFAVRPIPFCDTDF